MPVGITIVSQGKIVAESLADYLNRHPELETKITKNNAMRNDIACPKIEMTNKYPFDPKINSTT